MDTGSNFFCTHDLTIASKLDVLGFPATVEPHESLNRAVFKFQRTPDLAKAIGDLADGIQPQNPNDVQRAREQLRERAILAREAARRPAA